MSEPTRLWTLWTPYAGDSAAARNQWSELVARWSEPHRAYHSLEHLLLMLELLSGRGAEPQTMLAAWFHDAIYDPRSQSNEADSAALAATALNELGLAHYADRVSALVLLTATHEPDVGDEQATLLIDADLAILGQQPSIYLRYIEGVRREYAHVPDDEFRRGRSEILQGFIDHERIYRHRSFSSFEAQARANISAELAIYQRAASN